MCGNGRGGGGAVWPVNWARQDVVGHKPQATSPSAAVDGHHAVDTGVAEALGSNSMMYSF